MTDMTDRPLSEKLLVPPDELFNRDAFDKETPNAFLKGKLGAADYDEFVNLTFAEMKRAHHNVFDTFLQESKIRSNEQESAFKNADQNEAAELLANDVKAMVTSYGNLVDPPIIAKAFTGLIAGLIVTMDCVDCRKHFKKGIEKMFSKTMDSAMRSAAIRFAGRGSNHVH